LAGRAGVRAPLKKPSELIYGIDDVPPLYIVAFAGLQHIGLVTIFLVYPRLITKEIGASMALSANMTGCNQQSDSIAPRRSVTVRSSMAASALPPMASTLW
jgi:hypothetical protein